MVVVSSCAALLAGCPGQKREDRFDELAEYASVEPRAEREPVAEKLCFPMHRTCQNTHRIQLSSAAGWTPGKYRFEVLADDELTVCEGELPTNACEGPMNSIQCSGGVATVRQSVCGTSPGKQRYEGVVVAGTPREVMVRVERDGVLLAHRDFSPGYRPPADNARFCGSDCWQAEDQLHIAN